MQRLLVEHAKRLRNKVRSSYGGGWPPELHRGALDQESTRCLGNLRGAANPDAEAAGSPKRARFDEKLKFLPAVGSESPEKKEAWTQSRLCLR